MKTNKEQSDMFKKIWNDPVWSKVISAVIIGLAVYLYSIISRFPISEIWKKVVIYKSWIIVLIVIFLLISRLIYVRIRKNQRNVFSSFHDHDTDSIPYYKATHIKQDDRKFRK